MGRIIVAGGTGFFGGAAVELLRTDGFDPVIASRKSQFNLNVEDPYSIRFLLREGDVVLDAAGPFQDRTTTLVMLADEIGYDVVDISDSLQYCQRVLRTKIKMARILTACSSISVITASFILRSGIGKPVRLSTFLAPATRHASRPGAGTSLLRSIGRPIRVWEAGKMTQKMGWSDIKRLHVPPPIGCIEGRRFETADAVTLPPIWPSLQDIDFWVDTRIATVNRIFDWSARMRNASILENRLLQSMVLPLIRRMGSEEGAIAVEIEGDDRRERYALVGRRRGYYTPIIPAVIATQQLAADRLHGQGLIPAHRQVDPDELFAYLHAAGLYVVRL